tara:strand:+ start:181 stop:1092 length:912 start_codon:yes stop_codon:yes gene_type:complete
MKKVIAILVLGLLWCNVGFAADFEIRRFAKSSKKSYDKMEILFGDYRIYTHRPGGVKIRRISDNKQLVVFHNNFKIKYYNDGERIFDFILDEDEKKISLKYENFEILKWEGRFVEKHRAYFFQMFALGTKPFHYYIILSNGRPIGLDISAFDKKIAKAISKAKIRIAANYNISLEMLELILKRRQMAQETKLNQIIQEKEDELLQASIDNKIDEEINKQLGEELAKSIGEQLAQEFDAVIIEGMEQEFASFVDEAVSEAVAEGVSAATAEAAIRAIMNVFASGGTESEAMEACRAVAGDACDD